MQSEAQQPAEHRVKSNGIELAYFEWGAEHRGTGPTLLLAHATGFHARCWDPVVRRLGEATDRHPGLHIVAIDLRGHGRSDKRDITHWDVFGQDLAGVVCALDLRDVIGVGHSMGGHAMVDAAAAEADRFRRLVLIDPVIGERGGYGESGWKISELVGQQHPTAKRKRHFESSAAMIARFRDRIPYSVFEPDALDAYCTYGLLPAPQGEGFDLACPPEIEASIYMTSRTNEGVFDSIAALELPVLILRAKLPAEDRNVMDFSSSPTWPKLVDAFRNARDIHFADRTHFLPMEIPGRVAELILGELDAG